ncbi:hypothetical protein C8R47DRAFT_996120, partial [Mycena vitilis]
LSIRADNKIFKVTKSIVATRSSVFRDMVAFPQPGTPNDFGGEKIDGCAVVVLHDSARDVEAFLRAIFDSRRVQSQILFPYFMPPPEVADIYVILGILRLSHKYNVQYLHRRALLHLEREFYLQSAQAYRDSYDWDLPAYSSPTDTGPFQCILATIQAAHEVSALWLLPVAYYQACDFEDETIAKANVPGSQEYVQQCMKSRVSLVREHVVCMGFLKASSATGTCMLPRKCNAARLEGVELYFSYVADDLDVNPLQVWDRPEWTHIAEHGMCSPCLQKAQTMHSDALDKLWDRLPGIFDLPPWAELHAMRKAAMENV